ncbi:COPII vesicle coat component Erp5/Erp6 [Schizosaccharomyces cryophilus OY26]|uniref:COPII vesicle coat component Erp5/Erp6 n=1 Tax=Schizosaccharomyces cryophilus (strain OY26 / ATCC MYA-4695 / CBS 11777 / NBRC 106824 / NRRL Y48691) TaxID=653667 RepID=S9W6P3_SCHCR|nr:COPII vesicle coat component Erp5/Erp6 [Schizosaccharomyces cryophilus OY26]EPY54214.1 COPII vesicle coat component Erp5/Erp6 [Schizosaccharomyces cryophilus OY26]
MRLLTVFVFLFASFFTSNAIYFYFDGSKPKCFLKDMSKNRVVTGSIKPEQWNEDMKKWVPNDKAKIRVQVDETFANNHIIYQKDLVASNVLRFTPLSEGTHRICYISDSDGGWFSATKTRLHVNIGSDDKYNLIASSEDEAKDVADRVEALNSRLESIYNEQVKQRNREMVFRDSSEHANSRVVRWTIIQIVVLLISSAWQLSHLQQFFVKEKLV